jgi:hypothetical protein
MEIATVGAVTFQNHPVVCMECRRPAWLSVSMMFYYCPMCRRSVTAEEVYDKMGREVKNG